VYEELVYIIDMERHVKTKRNVKWNGRNNTATVTQKRTVYYVLPGLEARRGKKWKWNGSFPCSTSNVKNNNVNYKKGKAYNTRKEGAWGPCSVNV
jgi:hypothetical protein